MKNFTNSIGHFETILPHLFRRVKGITTTRERVDTPDGDFIDVDWIKVPKSEKLLILSHGLEGKSNNAYILGMAKYFSQRGWNVCAWNYRSCSGEINRLPRFYHSGDIDDLQFVINHALTKNENLQFVSLVGFSLGGNLTLKYLGDCSARLPKEITGACVFSVPCDLRSGASTLGISTNQIYEQNFLFTMKKKIIQKRRLGQLKEFNLRKILLSKNIIQFDNLVTAPLHGFLSGSHYYKECSSIFSIKNIKTPTQIINALNDPILSEESYPYRIVNENSFVELKTPKFGGHVGFMGLNLSNEYTSEQKSFRFLEDQISKRNKVSRAG